MIKSNNRASLEGKQADLATLEEVSPLWWLAPPPSPHFVVGLWMLSHGTMYLQESIERFILSPRWGGKGTRFVREQSDLRIV